MRLYRGALTYFNNKENNSQYNTNWVIRYKNHNKKLLMDKVKVNGYKIKLDSKEKQPLTLLGYI